MPEITILEEQDIKENFKKLQTQILIWEENKEYVKGDNPEILRKERKKPPDNRIPIGLAKAAVEDLSGYSGSQISVSYDNISTEETAEEEDAKDEYIEVMRSIQEYNNDDTVIAELYVEALSQGEVYLLNWISEELELPGKMLTPEYAIVGKNEMVVNYDKNLKPKLINAIRFIQEKKKIQAIVYYPGLPKRKTKVNGVEVEKQATKGFSQLWELEKEGSGAGKWKRVDKQYTTYPFERVPVCVFKGNKDGAPLFQAEKRIIDKHDEGVSKSQNEMDRFNALIALFPEGIDKKFMEKLEELKGIGDLKDIPGDQWPRYMEKSLEKVATFYNQHLDRLERLFHKSIKVVDFNNIAADGGDESGAARAFKLLGMEFKATAIERVFNKGLYERTLLFNDLISDSALNVEVSLYKPVISSPRNLPVDEIKKAQIAKELDGIATLETRLKILGQTLIPDPEKEAAAVEKQKNESAAALLKEFESNRTAGPDPNVAGANIA